MNSFRESINNLIRSDKPESPTNLIFMFGMLIIIALQVYATLTSKSVAHFSEMLVALGSFKTIKAASWWASKDTVKPQQEVVCQQQ